MELLKIISGKLHGIKVTESDLNYHGSVTIDEDIIRAAGFLPMEFVYIWNKNSGSRISTYVLPGQAGSGTVCLNGAAARSCQKGDEVIITACRLVTPELLASRKAKVLTFEHSVKINSVKEVLEYELSFSAGNWEFLINNDK